MTTPDRPPAYPITQFVKDLDQRWGGKLYFKVGKDDPTSVLDIRDKIPFAFKNVTLSVQNVAEIARVDITADPVQDFRRLVLAGMPHSKEAEDRVHLLVDPYCRDFLHAQLEIYAQGIRLRAGEEEFVAQVINESPLSFAEPNNEIFNTPLAYQSLDAYLTSVKRRSGSLVEKFPDLTDQEKGRFADEFETAMDRVSTYAGLIEEDHGNDLHPVIGIRTRLILLEFYKQGLRSHPLF